MTTIEEAIRRNVAAAPPLTAEQVRRLTGLLGTGTAATRTPPPPRLETDEEFQTRRTAALDKALSVCSRCGIDKARHTYPEHYGYISHGHESLSVEEKQRVIEEFIQTDFPKQLVKSY